MLGDGWYERIFVTDRLCRPCQYCIVLIVLIMDRQFDLKSGTEQSLIYPIWGLPSVRVTSKVEDKNF